MKDLSAVIDKISVVGKNNRLSLGAVDLTQFFTSEVVSLSEAKQAIGLSLEVSGWYKLGLKLVKSSNDNERLADYLGRAIALEAYLGFFMSDAPIKIPKNELAARLETLISTALNYAVEGASDITKSGGAASIEVAGLLATAGEIGSLGIKNEARAAVWE